jgi:hypothetical protein
MHQMLQGAPVGAVTIVQAPEKTIQYKLGHHAGLNGQAATPDHDSVEFYRDAYMLGYAAGYDQRKRRANKVVDTMGQVWIVFGHHTRSWGATLDLFHTTDNVEILDAPASEYQEV